MFRLSSWGGWWSAPRDPRELARLDLVGLAAEVATVARHVEAALAPFDGYPEAQEPRARSRTYLHMALLILSAETCFDEMGEAELMEALEVFRGLQRKVLRLRGEAERLGDSLPVC
jgi:hypothetical protein